ncbi:hypothetical protein M8818_001631 [Zalaria obscura]|uniref:Uncharacterized protein n=1 Tax=Zalaria obscura TaxID=2024903 RepID=A0ACC3SKT6_9PEZI
MPLPFVFEPGLIDNSCNKSTFGLNDQPFLSFDFNGSNGLNGSTVLRADAHEVALSVHGHCDPLGPLRQLLYINVDTVNGTPTVDPIGFTVALWPNTSIIVYEVIPSPFAKEIHAPPSDYKLPFFVPTSPNVPELPAPPLPPTLPSKPTTLSGLSPVDPLQTLASLSPLQPVTPLTPLAPIGPAATSIPPTIPVTSAGDQIEGDIVPSDDAVDEDAPNVDELRAIADSLREQILEQRKLIRIQIKACGKKLTEELDECDHGIACSTKAICRRLRSLVKHFLKNLEQLHNDADDLADKNEAGQSPMAGEKAAFTCPDLVDLASNSTLNGTANPFSPHTKIELVDPPSHLLRVLEILAAAVGLTALFSLIRRRFCSLRRRVERLADREERRKVREYRRAARKEAFRRKWRGLRGIFKRNCRNGDYEEKRALILEAAGMPVVDEEAGPSRIPGEVAEIEREISGLRQAHEVVASLVRNGRLSSEGNSGEVTPRAAPYVVPYMLEQEARSRSSSLPSYNADPSPDYTSQPGSMISASVAGRFRYHQAPSLTSSRTTIFTPDSSIPDLSPRCSRETLRTGLS